MTVIDTIKKMWYLVKNGLIDGEDMSCLLKCKYVWERNAVSTGERVKNENACKIEKLTFLREEMSLEKTR